MVSSTRRTAGCGPACPVVWEVRTGNRLPYPDPWDSEGFRILPTILGGQFNVCGISLRFGDGLSFFAQAIEMKSNGIPHVLFDFLAGATGGNTPRQVG